MTDVLHEKTEIEDFTDKEIRDEYAERFGDPDDTDLSKFSTSELIDELEERCAFPEAEPPSSLDEILDCIAYAAHTSPFAKRAYELIRDEWPESVNLIHVRQRLISGRMGDVA